MAETNSGRRTLGRFLPDTSLVRLVPKYWTYVKHIWYLPMRQHGKHVTTHRHKTDFTQRAVKLSARNFS